MRGAGLERVWSESRHAGGGCSGAPFAEAIPTELPTPTIGVEPDGALTFEWYRNPRLLLSLSVDASAALPYAAALPSGTISATEIFHGRVPQKLVAVIRRVHETGGQSFIASGQNIC